MKYLLETGGNACERACHHIGDVSKTLAVSTIAVPFELFQRVNRTFKLGRMVA